MVVPADVRSSSPSDILPFERSARRTGVRAWLCGGILAVASLVAPAAHAGGINHFEAAAGPHNYVVTNHPAVLRNLVPSAWMIVSYANDPLVFRDDSGQQVGPAIVANQVNLEVAAAIGLLDRFELGVVAPAFFMNGAGVDGSGLTAVGSGDLRVLGKALLTPSNEGVVASLRVSSDLVPVAQLLNSNRSAAALSGDTLPNVTPAFSVGFNSRHLRVGVDTGFLWRVPQQLIDDGIAVGSQVTYGAGAELSLIPSSMYLTTDVYGRASLQALGADRNRFPLEGNLAVKFFTGPMLLMLGGGTGLVPDYGTPDFRVFAAVGIFNRPDQDEDPALKDRDKDGIVDSVDACPDDPEDKDGYKDEDGCPEPDNDSDGIADGADDCPNDPEVKNGFEDDDGCPDESDRKKLVVVKRDRIEITEKVYFATDSDIILPQSYALLSLIGRVLNIHTEIPMIFIEGHTDSDGDAAYNLSLSDRRAKSVMRHLVERGDVDAERLKAQGFGEERPVDTNSTNAGKQNNRRVEFRIVDKDGEEADMSGRAFKTPATSGPPSTPASEATPDVTSGAPRDAAPDGGAKATQDTEADAAQDVDAAPEAEAEEEAEAEAATGDASEADSIDGDNP